MMGHDDKSHREALRLARSHLLLAWERSGQGALGAISKIIAAVDAELSGTPASHERPLDGVPPMYPPEQPVTISYEPASNDVKQILTECLDHLWDDHQLDLRDRIRAVLAAPSSTRREGHSALRVKDGKLEVFDPHPPQQDIVEAAKAWIQSVQVMPVLPPNAEEGFRAGAAWARSAIGARGELPEAFVFMPPGVLARLEECRRFPGTNIMERQDLAFLHMLLDELTRTRGTMAPTDDGVEKNG